MIRRSLKEKLHPRNRFRSGYDFPLLIKKGPGLTAFVAPNAHLPRLHHALRNVKSVDVKTIEMAHGQKKSRILAWTFGQ